MTAITTLIIREHALVECGPCECKDYITESSMSLEDFRTRYSIEDLKHNFDIICSDIVDAATGHILSEREIERLLRKDLESIDNCSIYYSREVEISLKDHGNTVHAVMHWFDDDEVYPYDEWSEEVELSDVKMMSERDIEEAIKEKLLETVDREFDASKLYFKWKV